MFNQEIKLWTKVIIILIKWFSEETHHIVITVIKQICFVYLLYIDKSMFELWQFHHKHAFKIPAQLMWS